MNMNIATRIENYIDGPDMEPVQKDNLPNIEKCVDDIFNYCWNLLDEYIKIDNQNETDLNNITHIKKYLYNEILRDFYITNGGFQSSNFVTAGKLIDKASNLEYYIGTDSRTIRNFYDSINSKDSTLYQKLNSFHLIKPSEKHVMLNSEFWQELYCLQINHKSLKTISEETNPSINSLLSDDNFKALTDFYKNTNHKTLFLDYLNRQYQFDYYLLSLGYLKKYMLRINDLLTLPKLWNEETVSAQYSVMSVADSYIGNLADKIARTIPYSLLSYNSTKHYCLSRCFLQYENLLLNSDQRNVIDSSFNGIYHKIVDFGFPEFFIRNSFLYALEYLNSKLTQEIWSEQMNYKDNEKTQPVNIEVLYRDLKKDTRNFPYNAETLLDLLSTLSLSREDMYPTGYSFGLPYNKDNLPEMISDESLAFVYEKCLELDSKSFYYCKYLQAEDYLTWHFKPSRFTAD